MKFKNRSGQISLTASPDGVLYGGPWQVSDFPSFFPHTFTPVNVLPVKEKTFIKQPNIFYGFSSDNLTSARDPINFKWNSAVTFIRHYIRASDAVIRKRSG